MHTEVLLRCCVLDCFQSHYYVIADEWIDLPYMRLQWIKFSRPKWFSSLFTAVCTPVKLSCWRWFAKRFLLPDYVAEYKNIFLWAEDLGEDNFDQRQQVYSSFYVNKILNVLSPSCQTPNLVCIRTYLHVKLSLARWVTMFAPPIIEKSYSPVHF